MKQQVATFIAHTEAQGTEHVSCHLYGVKLKREFESNSNED